MGKTMTNRMRKVAAALVLATALAPLGSVAAYAKHGADDVTPQPPQVEVQVEKAG